MAGEIALLLIVVAAGVTLICGILGEQAMTCAVVDDD